MIFGQLGVLCTPFSDFIVGCPKVTAAVLRSCSSKNDLLNALGGAVPSVNRWEMVESSLFGDVSLNC